jgi:hypothetical protein
MATRITYWYDRTSDYDNPRWIVSREDSYSSQTLQVLAEDATEDDARTAAERQARTWQLRVVRKPEED